MTPSLLHPRARRAWLLRRRFLSQFVGRGDLVFDVGANVGEYTQTFLELGARPVAIEPAPMLRSVLAGLGVPVESVAVSDRVGETVLAMGGGDLNSTVEPAYANVLARMGIDLTRARVPTVTLDLLAERYGEPAFVKIDVEGHEPAVLRGMRFHPPALSFEFHTSLLPHAAECLGLLEARGYRFRISREFDFTWATREIDAHETSQILDEWAEDTPTLFGDIYASDTSQRSRWEARHIAKPSRSVRPASPQPGSLAREACRPLRLVSSPTSSSVTDTATFGMPITRSPIADTPPNSALSEASSGSSSTLGTLPSISAPTKATTRIFSCR